MMARRAPRALHLDENANVDQIVEIAFAKQQSPAESTGEQFGGGLPDERSFPSAGFQYAKNNQTFDRLPDGRSSDLKSDCQLFLAWDQIARLPNPVHDQISQSLHNLLWQGGPVERANNRRCIGHWRVLFGRCSTCPAASRIRRGSRWDSGSKLLQRKAFGTKC